MKTRSGFGLVASLCSGLLSSLFGCYPVIETVPLDPIDFSGNEPVSNETTGVTQTDRLTREELIDKLETYLDTLEEAGFSGTVLVAQNGEIIFEEGYGLADRTNEIPNTSETVLDSGSLSKQFTATAILHLEERGLLRVEDTLAKFFDHVPPDKANITLHQLLTHSSGLPDYVYEGDFEEISRQQAVMAAFDASLEFQPGTDYLYSDTGYGLLAAIVETTSGQPFQTYLKQDLFEPAGMVHTGFYNDPQWTELPVAHGYNNRKDFGSAATQPGPYWGLLGFGGVLTTVGDLYSWNTALESNQILSEQSVTKLFTPYVKEDEDGESYYGYGWVIEELPGCGKMIWHDGATDSQNAIFIKCGDRDKTLVVVLSNRIDTGLFNETFYGTETGIALGNNILKHDFNDLPEYAR